VAIIAKSNQLASLPFFPPKLKIIHYFMNPISMKKPKQINDLKIKIKIKSTHLSRDKLRYWICKLHTHLYYFMGFL
jgi:hypothetical protein